MLEPEASEQLLRLAIGRVPPAYAVPEDAMEQLFQNITGTSGIRKII
jgi:hypothetical protein